MRRREFLRQSGLAAAAVSAADAAGEAATPERPNVLLMITDQQTALAVSCNGNKDLRTPAVDSLAAAGTNFTRAYVTQPLCLPCRSSLQTGRYPHEIGAVNNGRKIVGEFPMLGKLMGPAGYQCSYIGKWHVGVSPADAGYDDFQAAGRDPTKTTAACEYLRRKHDRPFFLTVSMMNPHNVCQLARGQKLPDGPIGEPPTDPAKLPPLPANFAVPKDEPSRIREVQATSKSHYPTADWTDLHWRQYLWGYYRLVEKVDAQIGQILAAVPAAAAELNRHRKLLTAWAKRTKDTELPYIRAT